MITLVIKILFFVVRTNNNNNNNSRISIPPSVVTSEAVTDVAVAKCVLNSALKNIVFNRFRDETLV